MGKADMPKCKAKAADSFLVLVVLRPQMEQLHCTGRMGRLGSHRGTNHTEEAQSPGWPGACLPVRGGTGPHRPQAGPRSLRVSSVQSVGQRGAGREEILKMSQQMRAIGAPRWLAGRRQHGG